jgi:hypothetical protein
VPPEARPLGEHADPTDYPPQTYSFPVDLVELQVGLDKVGGELERLNSTTEVVHHALAYILFAICIFSTHLKNKNIFSEPNIFKLSFFFSLFFQRTWSHRC